MASPSLQTVFFSIFPVVAVLAVGPWILFVFCSDERASSDKPHRHLYCYLWKICFRSDSPCLKLGYFSATGFRWGPNGVWLPCSYALNTRCLHTGCPPPPHSKSIFLLSHDLSLVHKNEDPVAHDFVVLGKALFPSPRLCKPAWGASMVEITHHVFASGSTPLWVFPVICKVVHTLCSSVWSLTGVPVTK